LFKRENDMADDNPIYEKLCGLIRKHVSPTRELDFGLGENRWNDNLRLTMVQVRMNSDKLNFIDTNNLLTAINGTETERTETSSLISGVLDGAKYEIRLRAETF